MAYDVVLKMRRKAEVCGAKFDFTKHSSEDYIDCEITRDGIDLSVTATKFGDNYFAYTFNSSHLPYDLYPDSIKRPGFTVRDRSEEILQTIDKVLLKKIYFHPQPRFYNKNRGYIILSIDGTEIKIFLKSN